MNISPSGHQSQIIKGVSWVVATKSEAPNMCTSFFLGDNYRRTQRENTKMAPDSLCGLWRVFWSAPTMCVKLDDCSSG